MRPWPQLDPDLTLPTWRARAVRYLLIYVALVVALVSVRASTSEVRPGLRAAQLREQTLITQRDNLALQLQTLETKQRIMAWAQANGMELSATAVKGSADIQGIPDAPAVAPQTRTVEVVTKWK
ncbi:hypothetical protein [Deinococcus radiotolerans]|uniref:Cell division protein FtsL n=1 Tax=Deinococcus radiotolerans TaxID=1309407 RepID=A0ABQ2FJY9_9DEIO|nr:hypothetical protein [Deinococcus radiotolerans]GGL05525.1 hypothetical protein GCM10010844_25390 [Deinococcus radiotolerans]